tara:strand:+ start:787 stop:1011 length:225 start_codon:yes stop_codon:yes gene_type:complete
MYRRAVQHALHQVDQEQLVVGYFIVDALVSVAIANCGSKDANIDDISILQRLRKNISFVGINNDVLIAENLFGE